MGDETRRLGQYPRHHVDPRLSRAWSLAADLDPLNMRNTKDMKHRLIQRIMGLQMRTWIPDLP